MDPVGDDTSSPVTPCWGGSEGASSLRAERWPGGKAAPQLLARFGETIPGHRELYQCAAAFSRLFGEQGGTG